MLDLKMNKYFIPITIFLLSIFLSGCGTMHRNTSSKDMYWEKYIHQNNNIFASTRFDIKGIDAMIHPRGSDLTGLRPLVTTIEIPLVIIDTPISMTTDIICCPYDVYDFINKKHTNRFWDEVIKKQITNKPYSYYDRNISRNTLFFISNKIKDNKNVSPSVLRKLSKILLAFQLKRSKKDEDVFYSIIYLSKSIAEHKMTDTVTLKNLFSTLSKPRKKYDSYPFFFEIKIFEKLFYSYIIIINQRRH